MPAWADIRSVLARACVALALTAAGAQAQTSDLVSGNALRVCADPANYPMSTKDGTGYENKLTELIAAKLELPVRYTCLLYTSDAADE